MKTTKTAKTKAAFCESFAWEHIDFQVEWFDLVGLYELAGGVFPKRLAKLELSERGCHGSYVGFLVTIINTITGPIDSKFFLLSDYLDRSNAKDIRNDGKGSSSPMPDYSLQVKKDERHGHFEWYLLEPKDTSPLCEAIAGYVRSFEQ